jgi:hypothetical protein
MSLKLFAFIVTPVITPPAPLIETTGPAEIEARAITTAFALDKAETALPAAADALLVAERAFAVHVATEVVIEFALVAAD